jgi:FtsP/CotA-like multicopper oxidase with cupredoxin domain
VVDVLFEKAGEWAVEHQTPRRTYRLAAIAVGGEPARPLATAFDVLRVDSDLKRERSRLAAAIEASPDKTLAFVAEMDMGEPEHSHGAEVVYACPMHPEVVGEEPGRCPQCGMKLLAAERPQAAYVCPMHPEVTSGKEERCPKCGMKLVPDSLARPATSHAHEGDEHGYRRHASAAPAGIEWEDDMLEVNRRTNPTNTRWKLVDRSIGAEGSAIDWRFRVGQRVKIRLVNEMDSDHPMQHPFHLHGAGRFLILSRDGAVESNLVWKDTVLVPAGQTVDILFEITHPGVWMAHCHIAEHHESGMMLDFRVER